MEIIALENEVKSLCLILISPYTFFNLYMKLRRRKNNCPGY